VLLLGDAFILVWLRRAVRQRRDQAFRVGVAA